MAATRNPDEIKLSIERNRRELVSSVEQLRGKVREMTDWRAQINRNRTRAVVGAAVAGFVVAGGVAGVTSLLFRRRRE
ncbi:MAG: DUF3618 domain-containing protein [Solirubrobacterales bacterium]